jgi:hypothetical protein
MRNTDESIDKYKARNINNHQRTDNKVKTVASYQVALGNHQPKSSYNDIKSPTARSATSKLIMSIQVKLSAFSRIVDITEVKELI